MIGELIGIPNERLADFLGWTEVLITANPGRAWESNPFEEIYREFTALLDERRAAPRDDLMSALIAAELDGERLSQEELLGFCFLLVVGGNDTTTNLIANAAVLLARHPAPRSELIDDPSLIPGAVEEAVRYDTPTQALPRIRDAGNRSSGCERSWRGSPSGSAWRSSCTTTTGSPRRRSRAPSTFPDHRSVPDHEGARPPATRSRRLRRGGAHPGGHEHHARGRHPAGSAEPHVDPDVDRDPGGASRGGGDGEHHHRRGNHDQADHRDRRRHRRDLPRRRVPRGAGDLLGSAGDDTLPDQPSTRDFVSRADYDELDTKHGDTLARLKRAEADAARTRSVLAAAEERLVAARHRRRGVRRPSRRTRAPRPGNGRAARGSTGPASPICSRRTSTFSRSR